MDLNALKQAVAGGATMTAPGSSPNSTGANAFAQAAIGNIQNLAGSNYQVASTGAAGNMLEGAVTSRAKETAAAEEAARDAEAARLKQEQEELQKKVESYSDPKAYKKVINEAGGYDFFDPDGEKISLKDYAKIQNQHTTDVLKDSEDPNDKYFRNDYDKIQKLVEITDSGDKAAYEKFLKKEPEMDKWMKENNIKSSKDAVGQFRRQYPGYFQSTKPTNVRDTPLLGGGNDILEKLKAFFGK